MGIGIRVGQIVDEIGTPSFFHAFFSTVSANLEPSGWGSRYPKLLRGLYQGNLPPSDVGAALAESRDIRRELARFAPDRVVWDIENRSARPPWGDEISKDITDLSNYFVTSGGRDLFDVLTECLEAALKKKIDVSIE